MKFSTVLARVFPSIGTRSVLFGAHQFLLHPTFLFVAWWKLYGAPRDPRLLLAFVLHDLGYWGKGDLDGEEGERHPEWAAHVMGRLFGEEWQDLCLYHSRFYARRDGKPTSRLCLADKLALVLTPAWLYLPLARLTGELAEYMRLADDRHAAGEPRFTSPVPARSAAERWYRDVQEYMSRYVDEHRDGRPDTWTPEMGRVATTASGVWQ